MIGYLVLRSLVGLALFALLSCSSAAPHDAGDVPPVSFGKKGETTTFTSVCRYEIRTLPPVLTIFRHTLEVGGLTCFQGDHGVLFVPRRDAACPRRIDVATTSSRSVSLAEAAAEYRQCSAIALPPSSGPSELTIYRPNPAHPGSDDTFIDFVLDAGALVGNDMLPVTLFLPAGDVLCMESPDARRAARRISEAEIAEPSEFLVEFGTGSCRDASSGAHGS